MFGVVLRVDADECLYWCHDSNTSLNSNMQQDSSKLKLTN